ncbi:MAG: NmrA/HSCARG family protein [Nitrospirae bacterium]|nr:NmrA/HSCARG family protein [Nitrospirota bacterium]
MDKTKDIILVTGATGRQGGAAARQLLSKGYCIRVLTRDPQSKKAKDLSSMGAQIVQGDFDDDGSLDRALKDVWGVYSVQNTWEAGVVREEEQGKRFAALARKKGVMHFVYSSVGSAHRSTGIPHFDNKWRIEERIRGLAFPSYTIIRPAFFMENFVSPSFKPGLMEGKLIVALKPDTVLQMNAVEDIGKFVLLAFEQHEKMNGVALDIAGDQHTIPETAEILGRAMGKRVEFVRQPIEEVRKGSEDFAVMLEWFDRVGYNADIDSLGKNYGVRLIKLPEWAAQEHWK